MYILDLNNEKEMKVHDIKCPEAPKKNFAIIGKFNGNYKTAFSIAKKMAAIPELVNGCELCTPSCYTPKEKEK